MYNALLIVFNRDNGLLHGFLHNIVCSLVTWRRWKEKQGCKGQRDKAAQSGSKTLETTCTGTLMVTSAETLPETNSKEVKVFKLTENVAYTETNSKEVEVFKLSENIAYTPSVEYKKDTDDGYETIPV